MTCPLLTIIVLGIRLLENVFKEKMMKRKSSAAAVVLGALVLFACEGPVAGLEVAGSGSGSRTILPTPTSTSTFLQGFTDNRLVAGYKAEVKYYNPSLGYTGLTLHYGFNGWNEVREVPLQIVPGAQDAHVSIQIPDWAHTLDYVVYALQADGTKLWDNRGETDYHVPVYQAVSSVSSYQGRREVELISRLDNPVLHFGTDGWKNVQEVTMNRAEYVISTHGVKKYTAILSGIPESAVLDYCFRDNGGNWLNNGGQNWYHSLQRGLVNVWPANDQTSLYYREIVGLPVQDYLNGKLVETFPMTLTHSGAYLSAIFPASAFGDHTYVIDALVEGYRYYATASQRVTRYGTHVYLEIKKTALK